MRNCVRVLLCLVFCLPFAGCVSQKTTAVDDTNQFQGKTVAVTARPRVTFMAATAGKAMFAIAGAFAMAASGNSIVAENGIGDPAPMISQDLLTAAEKRYGVMAASMAAVPIKSTDTAELARAATGADFLIDVECNGQSFSYFPTDWTHYSVGSDFSVRVIDVRKAKLIAEGHCAVDSRSETNHPTRDELLANKAVRLKATLDAQSAQCAAQFRREVLKIPD
jgi:hypothetical protein